MKHISHVSNTAEPCAEPCAEQLAKLNIWLEQHWPRLYWDLPHESTADIIIRLLSELSKQATDAAAIVEWATKGTEWYTGGPKVEYTTKEKHT